MAATNLCAIHQPNFLPRLSTLAKLYVADTWVVLDDVQYNGRDYQNRCRLGATTDPLKFRWLTLPVHRPNGRASLIADIRLVNQRAAQYRATELIRQHCRPAPHWPLLSTELRPVFAAIATTDQLSAIAEVSTLVLLRLLGWTGEVVGSSQLPSRCGRSNRLADLVHAVGGTAYLCGTGGRRYLDRAPFDAYGLPVRWFEPPPAPSAALNIWTAARHISALWPISQYGVDMVRTELGSLRS